MITSRRSFLGGILGIIAAPAVVKASSLMPISVLPPIFVPDHHWVVVQVQPIDLWDGTRFVPGVRETMVDSRNLRHVRYLSRLVAQNELIEPASHPPRVEPWAESMKRRGLWNDAGEVTQHAHVRKHPMDIEAWDGFQAPHSIPTIPPWMQRS